MLLNHLGWDLLILSPNSQKGQGVQQEVQTAWRQRVLVNLLLN